MRCPNCGIENPTSEVTCQCGYSLKTGPVDVQQSLAEQASSIREEVEKIRVDAGVESESKTISKPKVSTARKVLFITSGILLILFAVLIFVGSIVSAVSEEIPGDELEGFYNVLAIIAMVPIGGGVYFFYKASGSRKGIYTKGKIVASAFVGGPLAPAYLMSQNFRMLRNDDAAKKSMLIGIIATVVVFGGLVVLPEEVVETIPNSVIPLITMAVAGYAVKSYQEKQIEEYLKKGGEAASTWKALLVAFGFFFLEMLFLIFLESLAA